MKNFRIKNTNPVVLTLGTFDGVHRGHQSLLRVAERRARALGGEVLAVAFERPPRLFFHPTSNPTLLTTPNEKKDLLRRFGAQRVESLIFDQRLAGLSAEQFFQRYLAGRWAARELVVGFNFLFGKDRAGDRQFLDQQAQRSGMRVHRVGPVRGGGEIVSSGRIRVLAAEGRLSEARTLLGHAYTVHGDVERGRGIGRKLGYPTANLSVRKDKILPHGVFAAKVILPTGVERRGMINIGFRPTLKERRPRRSVEVHILDFTGDLGGRGLRVEFVKKLREEITFPSLCALVRQIGRDEAAVRKLPTRAWEWDPVGSLML